MGAQISRWKLSGIHLTKGDRLYGCGPRPEEYEEKDVNKESP